MDNHTGFTSSDSEVEEERREDCVANTSLPFIFTSPLAKAGKANSTRHYLGKNLSDISYAAGCSTIRTNKRTSSPSHHSALSVELKTARKKRINSTLIGAKYARNMLDLSELPVLSPITPTSPGLFKTIPTDGAIVHKTGSDLSEARDRSLVSSSTGNWVTEPEVEVACKPDTPSRPNVLKKAFTQVLDQLEEESHVGDRNNLGDNRLRRSVSAATQTAPSLTQQSPPLGDFLQVNSVQPPGRVTAVGQVPVANSTPVQHEPITLFETSPSVIHGADDSELQSRHSTRFTLSMYDEMVSSPLLASKSAVCDEQAVTAGEHDERMEESKRTVQVVDSTADASDIGGGAGDRDKEQTEKSSLFGSPESIAKYLQATNERTPSLLVDEKRQVGHHRDETQHRPAKEKVVHKKKLRFSTPRKDSETGDGMEEVPLQSYEEISFPDGQKRKVYSARKCRRVMDSKGIGEDALPMCAALNERMRISDEDFLRKHPERFEELKHIPLDPISFL